MPDPHDEIAEIEAEIERLAASAERCRKTMTLAKLASLAGGLLFLVTVTGLLRLPVEAVLLGIAAALAGIATFGSTRSTLDGLTATIRAEEARRAALIGGIGLRVVEGGRVPRLGDRAP